MTEGSWLPSFLPKQEFGNIGFIPMFPALDEIYYGLKDPNQALQESAAKSAKVLGW
jgi:hypothetical protein